MLPPKQPPKFTELTKDNLKPLKPVSIFVETPPSRQSRDAWRLEKRRNSKKHFPPFPSRAAQDAWLESEENEFQRLSMELLDKGLKHNHHRRLIQSAVPMLEMVEPKDLIDGQS